ncbi:hypothetical protein P692DRAFT_20920259, partial [Suillus brevipes Sb2]
MIPDIRLANRLPHRRKPIHLTSIRSQMCIGAMHSCAIVPVGLMEDRGCLLDGAWSASTRPARMAQRMATIVVLMLAVNFVCVHHVCRCDPSQNVDLNRTESTSFTAVRQV